MILTFDLLLMEIGPWHVIIEMRGQSVGHRHGTGVGQDGDLDRKSISWYSMASHHQGGTQPATTSSQAGEAFDRAITKRQA